MKVDSQGNQVSEPSDMVRTEGGPATCVTCGRWRAVGIGGAALCCGCGYAVVACTCKGEAISDKAVERLMAHFNDARLR